MIIDKVRDRLWSRWWERVITVTVVVAAVLFALGESYELTHKGKVYPGVMAGSLALGGLTFDEAEAAIEDRIGALRASGLGFVFRDRIVNVPFVATATEDPDLSYEFISFDTGAMSRAAAAYGRDGNFLRVWGERIGALIDRAFIDPAYTWREENIKTTLQENFSSFETPSRDAALEISGATAVIKDERGGLTFDYDKALRSAQDELDALLFAPIPLKLAKEDPRLRAEDARPLLPAIQEAIRQDGAKIIFEDKTWDITANDINALFEVRLDEDDDAVFGLNQPRLAVLLGPIKKEVNVAVKEPKFKRENGKVVEFQGSVAGREINETATREAWEEALLKEKASELSLAVDEARPKEQIADLNDLGIREILGVGKSGFAGSPANRRHNIKVGAEAVNGSLIAPGEEFSLLKTLGDIDASTGYLPELVIKGNRTVPEYGGGLCQIGTTVFRGTLAAGLPILERQNHSYSVTYYYDDKGLPGTDATIYNPKPDYRFLNDTGNHVLILTRIEGDNLYFEFWGTKDGRTRVQSDTRVWDRISPPPPKYIETLDLPVGQKKCTEKPHAGMKAAFDYTITYPDGKEKKTTFTSQYRPWQEVCLIGVETLSTETATTTPEQLP